MSAPQPQISVERHCRLRAEANRSSVTPLSRHVSESIAKVDVLEGQSLELSPPDTGVEHEEQDRRVGASFDVPPLDLVELSAKIVVGNDRSRRVWDARCAHPLHR